MGKAMTVSVFLFEVAFQVLLLVGVGVGIGTSIGNVHGQPQTSFSAANAFDNCLALAFKVTCSEILFDPARNDPNMSAEAQRIRSCKLLDCQLRVYRQCLSKTNTSTTTWESQSQAHSHESSSNANTETEVYGRLGDILERIEGRCPEFNLKPSGVAASTTTTGRTIWGLRAIHLAVLTWLLAHLHIYVLSISI